MGIPANSSPTLPVERGDRQQGTQQQYQAIFFWMATVLAALCIDFGAFHRLHNSDSIVPVMVSLYRWTPFYWEQDRLGMLVPLLAIPFRDPLANLLAQSAFNLFCGLAAFFLCARYVVRRAWLFTGAISTSLFLLFNSKETRFQYLGLAQPYGVGLFLGLGGLLLLENLKYSRSVRIAFSLICLLAASWVNAALIFVLLPLIFFRWYFDHDKYQRSWVLGSIQNRSGKNKSVSSDSWRNGFPQWMLRAKRCLNHELGIATVLVFLSFVASYIFSGIASHSAAYGDWPYSPVQPWRLPAAWFQFGKNVWTEYLIEPWGIAVASLLVLGVFVRLLPHGRIHRTNPPALNLITCSLVSFLLMGSLSHIQSTEFDPRFALQSMVLLQVGVVAWALLPVHALVSLRWQNALMAAGIFLFLSTPLYLYGWPSLARVRTDLNETLGKYTAEILQSGATHIVGDYWKVWPATFHVNMTLYEMGSDRRVWGVTIRSTPTRVYWSKIPLKKTRLAALVSDPEVRPMLKMYSFPPVKEEQRFKDIVILTPLSDLEREPFTGVFRTR
jgi:hypothetical protein